MEEPQPLKTYLRTYRKRTCLSQDEVAFLIGGMCGTTVSRHEKAKRIPVLDKALGYAFILCADVMSLYEGLFLEVQEQVRVRAKGLRRGLEKKPQTARRDQKIALLDDLLDEERNVIRRMF